MKSKINNIVLYFGFILIALIVLILIIVDKNIYYMCKADCILENKILLLIIGILSAFFLVYKFKYKFVNIKKVNIIYLFFFSNILLLIYQLYFSWNIYFHTGWDCGEMIKIASSIVFDSGYKNTFYFSMYPNNVMLTYIFCFLLQIAKILNISDPYFMLVIISNILVNISGVLLVCIVHKVFHNTKISAYAFVMYVLLIGISPWLVIPYSDTYSLVFPTLAMYIYVNIKEDKRDIWKWFLLFIVCFLGFKIKPTNIIILIAIILISLVNYTFNKKNNLILFKKLVALIGAYLIIALFANHAEMYLETHTGSFDEQSAFTYMHFLMMGLNEERTGVYAPGDVEFSNSFNNIADREEAELEIIKNRLRDYGLAGYIDFLKKKILVIYNDGTFSWGMEGEFYKEYMDLKDNHISEIFRNVYYNDGKHYFIFRLLKQILWMTVLVVTLGIAIGRNKNDKEFLTLLISILSIVGLTVFLLLFEARARYLFCYTPIFILCSTFGIRNINEFIKSKMIH